MSPNPIRAARRTGNDHRRLAPARQGVRHMADVVFRVEREFRRGEKAMTQDLGEMDDPLCHLARP